MKIELNPEVSKNVQTTAVADAAPVVPASSGHTVKSNGSAGLSQDMWDKRNLMNSIKAAWDSEDTAVISDNAKRGIGIVGDPRIVGDESAE